MKSLLVFSLFMLSTVATANVQLTNEQVEAMKITKVDVYRIDGNESFELERNYVEAPTNDVQAFGIGDISIMLDNILAIGKKIWTIVEDGKPVVDEKLAPAVYIIPNVQSNPGGVLTEMANWSMPKVVKYHFSFKNAWDVEVIGFNYALIFQHSGTFNEVGKYIAGLKIVASDIKTLWGFKFSATSELVSIANVGSSADPVASGIINVSYTAKSVATEYHGTRSIYVDGRGKVKSLNKE